MSPRERRLLLALVGSLTFASVYAGFVMAPVLTQIAGEFAISTGTAGLVTAAYGGPGILTSLLMGPYSDRFGRRVFLVAGAFVMGVFTLLSAFATSFEMLIAMRAIAGIGGSVIFPNANALIGDSFEYRERGRAMSTVIAFNTMASVVGIPLAGVVAEATSWRLSVGFVGVLAMLAGLALWWFLKPAEGNGSAQRISQLYRSILTNSSAVAAIISSFLGSLYWFTWITYLVVFFQHTFALSQGTASTYSLTMGLGVLVGSQIGGRIGDRIGHRRVVAITIVISGALLLALTNLPLPLLVAASLNLALSAVIGARFATNTSLLSEQVPQARGTLLALSSATIAFAIVVGATLGGFFVDTLGFGAIGVFCMGAAILSCVIVLAFVHEDPIDLEIASV
ncbi:MAG TPA: MFS transporter [Candidatus Limnocylindria bacterium]|nr:MFS transporter [Candidatus Limnocylindria bacterium]